MLQISIKSAVAAALGVVALGVTAGPAKAQFNPFFGPRPGIYTGGLYVNPITRSYGLTTFNVPLGFGLQYDPIYRSAYFPLANFGNVAGVPIYGFVPLTGGYGRSSSYGALYNSRSLSYSGGYNPLVRDQIRALGGYGGYGTGYGGANEVEARRMLAGQWEGQRPANGAKPAGDGKPVAVDPNLMNAPEDQVLSGKALNDLAAAIRGLESKGAKADSPLLPAGHLVRVEYTGGPAADALMLLRGGKVEFPDPLRSDRFDRVRGDLEQPIAGVADPVLAGKRVEAPAADRLAAAVRKAKADVAPAAKEMTVSDATAVTRFFDRLLALAEVARTPAAATGLVVPKWSTIGASASELVSHLDRHKIAFGPAGAGGQEAYDTVYRGLVGYYLSLAQAGKK